MLITIKKHFLIARWSLLPVVLLFFMVIYTSCHNARITSVSDISAPTAVKKTTVFKEFGHERKDDYYWIRNNTDTTTLNLLKAENAYADRILARTEKLRQTLLDELVTSSKSTVITAPMKSRGYWYYSRMESGREFPIHYRKKDNWNAPEEMILNLDKIAKGFKVFRMPQFQVSPDNNYIAFMVDTVGDRNYTIFIKDLRTGKYAEKSNRNINSGGFFWANDSKTIFYIQNDKLQRGYRLLTHKLNTEFETDKVVYEEIDNVYWLTLTKSRSREYIFLTSESYVATEVAYFNANKPDDTTRNVMIPRKNGILYYANHYKEDSFYIFNNYQATNFKLSKAPLSTTSIESWKDVIPHSDSSLLMKYEILDDYIVFQNRVKGSILINILEKANNSIKKVDFDEESYNAEFYVADFDNLKLDSIRYNYQSLKTPFSTFKYDIKTRKKTLLSQDVIENYNPKNYATKRILVPSRDGERIPVSLVYKKGAYSPNGKKPLILTVYGAYGVNYEADFSPEIISLLNRGVAFAIAHVRGGQELGRKWYEDGRALKKKNTFNDYIDCAEYLIKNQYVAPDKLCADGMSAGGLVVCVAANERPDLFRVMTPELPWTDAITDAYDVNLPLTSQEWEEWGDARNEATYDYMKAWSPYDNIKKAAYPAILTTSAFYDTQVPYYSPAKWALKLRDNNTGTHPIIHRCLLETGHAGPSGRYETYREMAIKYAFILTELGIKK